MASRSSTHGKAVLPADISRYFVAKMERQVEIEGEIILRGSTGTAVGISASGG
jgi:hypothetical protein